MSTIYWNITFVDCKFFCVLSGHGAHLSRLSDRWSVRLSIGPSVFRSVRPSIWKFNGSPGNTWKSPEICVQTIPGKWSKVLENTWKSPGISVLKSCIHPENVTLAVFHHNFRVRAPFIVKKRYGKINDLICKV